MHEMMHALPEGASIAIRHPKRILKLRLRQQPVDDATDFGTYARRLFEPLGGVEIELPPREPMREPPDFKSSKPPHRRRRR